MLTVEWSVIQSCVIIYKIIGWSLSRYHISMTTRHVHCDITWFYKAYYLMRSYQGNVWSSASEAYSKWRYIIWIIIIIIINQGYTGYCMIVWKIYNRTIPEYREHQLYHNLLATNTCRLCHIQIQTTREQLRLHSISILDSIARLDSI